MHRIAGFVFCLLALLATMSGAGADHSSVFPQSPPPAKNLLHVNLLNSSPDVRLAVTVLQGLVNRTQPRIYITQDPGWHTPAMIPKWMDGLRQRGYAFQDVQDPLSLFATFSSAVKGAALYEPDLEKAPESLHKLNVLTLYCSFYGAIPVTESLNAKLHLPVLLDARGKLNDPYDAYDFAYRKLWPLASRRAVAFLCPSHIVLRDYLVANCVMPFWVSKGMSRVGREMALRFLREASPNTPVMGCWGGYGEKPPGAISEPEIQRLASRQAKFVVVSDGCFNLTVHSGLTFKKPDAPARKAVVVPQPGKVYLCLNFTDGDNLQLIQQYFRMSWWDDPNRGKIPLSWTMNPSAAGLMPDVLEYVMSTCTPNDELVCSNGGIGVICPSLYAADLRDREQVYEQYLRINAQAMTAVGFAVANLGDTSGVPWTRSDFDKWARDLPMLAGILGDYGPVAGVTQDNAILSVAEGIPVIRSVASVAHTGSNHVTPQEFANLIEAATPKSRPAYMHVSLVNWYNTPSTVMEGLKLLGSDYVPVLPSQMFALMGSARSKAEDVRLQYEFTKNSEGWEAASDIKDMRVSNGALVVNTTGLDPYIVCAGMSYPAIRVKSAAIRMKVGQGGRNGQFFFITSDSAVWDESKCLQIPVTADGKWHEYVLPLATHPQWKGIVTGIRLDPTSEKAGLDVAVDYIRCQ